MNKIKIAGLPFQLAGEVIKVGSPLNFKAVDKDGKDFSISSLTGPKVVSVFPDISTRLCDMQTHEIAKLAMKYPKATFLSISVDGVDVIKQWCAANGLDNILIVSDAKYQDFGDKTNLRITKTKKLARGAILLDEDNRVADLTICAELKDLPDMEKVEAWARSISN